MMMATKKGPGPGGGGAGGKAEAEAASEVWCRRVRELGGSSQAGNRHCFECAQRGVTYVDITVGSFVCTACSGLLRGLNPPHRVKSISMTTFTEPEVLFLQSRGNEVCRKIWLGLFDARTSIVPDSRDPQKVKEFLQEKYEKKRWYVPPDQVKGPAGGKVAGTSVPGQSSTPEVQPLRTLLGDPVPALTVATSGQARLSQHRGAQPAPVSSAKKASTDLLADIGGDPFAAPPQPPAPPFAAFPAFGGQAPAHGGFANFDAFGGSGGPPAFGAPQLGHAPFQAQPAPAASRIITGSYSFGSSQVMPFGASPLTPASQPSGLSDMGAILGSGSVFGAVAHVPAYHAPAAPGAGGSGGLAYGAFTNPFTAPAAHPPLPSTNPFQPNGLVSGPSGFGLGTMAPGFPPAQPPGGFPVAFPASTMFSPQTQLSQQQQQLNGSSFGGLGAAKPGVKGPGQPTAISTNPFVTGTSPSPFASKPPTTNPFL
ncbi:arf-GAP domain and FG repeat-containing protein 2 [Ornithorhynchus anatinus]|nr:arf-GAP domain and FG repeat-containing protein 2 [Ornithorhynchus anatinus]